jgi:signal transduction histidine kinase
MAFPHAPPHAAAVAALTPAQPTAAASALVVTWSRMRAELPRMLVVLVVLCFAIAMLLNALNGRWVSTHLVYSFAIGTSCTVLTQALRLALAGISDLLRGRFGLPPDPSACRPSWRFVIPATLIGVVLGMPLGLWIADAITGFETGSLFGGSGDARVTIAMTLLGTAVSVLAISSIERLGAARADAEAARRQAAENQLRLLQSQLEPHMLFNTLATLRVLIGSDVREAQAMLDRLIAYLRATLNASRTPLHPLATEFARVADYLALMALRMGPRLDVALDLPAALRDTPVPPLVLQPLVENSIQHGLEPKVAGGRITVSARAEGGVLVLEVRDSGIGLQAAPAHETRAPTSGTGFGLTGIRERLVTLYGNRASLALAEAETGGVVATLRIPLAAGPDPARRVQP